MATNAWGVTATAPTTSSWADHVDEEEAAGTLPPVNTDFPSLGEAVKQVPKAKKKGQKLDLNAFLAGGGGQAARASDKDILASLPKAPQGNRDPAGDDGRSGLGGGFKEYGGYRGGGAGGDEGRPERRNRDEYVSSRADDNDWNTKEFKPSSDGPRGGFGGGDRRGGGFGDRPASAADEINDWGSTKKFEPSAARPGGFKDGPPRRAGFDNGMGAGKADEEDQWSRGRGFQPSEPTPSKSGGGGRGFGFSASSAADEGDRWGKREAPAASEPGPTRVEGERPRLKLQPRSKPAEENSAADTDTTKKASLLFGAARPREEVLKEKGVDYHKEELKLEHGVIRDETPEEKSMKNEVENLRKKLELVKASAPDTESIADEIASAQEDLDAKEKELYKLQTELDDKIRFAKAPPLLKEKSSDHEGGFKDIHSSDKQPQEGKDVHNKQGSREGRDRAPREDKGQGREGAVPFAGAPGKSRW